MSDFKAYLAKIADGETLSPEEATGAFELIMSGEATQAQMAAFLMGLRMRGVTVAELTAGAAVMRAKAKIVTAPEGAIDIVGTGGDGAHTYNISTAAVLVVAGCGVTIAKHGNRAASSKSGTADALSMLGLSLDLPPDAIARCIREAGVGFMFAPAHHTAMKFVGPVRAELGIRTIFNLLGPLSNPAFVKRQTIGVFAKRWVEPFAEVLRNLGSEHAWVVHGSDGLDEITTTGPTFVAELKDGKISTFNVTPEAARGEGADRPEPVAVEGLGVAQQQQRGGRGERRGHCRACHDEQHGGIGDTRARSEGGDERRRAERTHEGEAGVGERARRPEHGDAEHDREGRARRHAEQPGVGDRVARHPLHESARDAQARPGEQADDGARHAQLAHDDEVDRIEPRVVGPQHGGEHRAEIDAARAQREARDHGEQQRDHEHDRADGTPPHGVSLRPRRQ